MTVKPDFQKPVEMMQALMAMQANAIGKTIEMQKKNSEELMAFFQTEVEKAKTLKTPEDVVKFNVDANTKLFNLMKAQGEAFTQFATQASQTAMAELQKLAK